ncbi:hypothetical protein EWB00_001628 [Schistosoma japonicum]|uniref:Uncharacterized protein n=1 Tax=Schistosoma japonicum TaxID=6182 RepID=A0A4Z2CK07_SCHJA|nr:hypothetical protein EWB00_001628 [Schistosoma japonicum]
MQIEADKAMASSDHCKFGQRNVMSMGLMQTYSDESMKGQANNMQMCADGVMTYACSCNV